MARYPSQPAEEGGTIPTGGSGISSSAPTKPFVARSTPFHSDAPPLEGDGETPSPEQQSFQAKLVERGIPENPFKKPTHLSDTHLDFLIQKQAGRSHHR
jgi:hypothetical protein